MYIEKIFSEVESDERLYSVLMNEEEYSLFSEFEERVFNTRAAKQINNQFFKKIGKLITKSNTIYNKQLGRAAVKRVVDPLELKIAFTLRKPGMSWNLPEAILHNKDIMKGGMGIRGNIVKSI